MCLFANLWLFFLFCLFVISIDVLKAIVVKFEPYICACTSSLVSNVCCLAVEFCRCWGEHVARFNKGWIREVKNARICGGWISWTEVCRPATTVGNFTLQPLCTIYAKLAATTATLSKPLLSIDPSILHIWCKIQFLLLLHKQFLFRWYQRRKQAQTTNPVDMGRKSRQYTMFQYSVQARLFVLTPTG